MVPFQSAVTYFLNFRPVFQTEGKDWELCVEIPLN